MRARTPALLTLAAALVLAGGLASPAAAIDPCYLPCPCWERMLPEQDPLICHANPSAPPTNTFAYFGAPVNAFLQVTDVWCRANGRFHWLNPSQRLACDWQLRSACGLGDDFSCSR